MAIVSIPVMYGNCSGSKSLHGSNRIVGGRDWAARVPDMAAAINSAAVWIFNASEVHAPHDDGWSDSTYPAGGMQYLLDALKALASEWTIAGGAEGNWTYYRNTHLSVVAVNHFHFSMFDRALTDTTFQDTASGFQFHNINSHFTAHQAKSHDKARAIQARETLKYMRKLPRAYFGGDINSSTYRKGFPRDIFTKGGLLGLRERLGVGSITNGGLSSFSKSVKQSYWLDEFFTRKSETVTYASLVLVNGVSGSTVVTDHNWLKATVGFDAGALVGTPTGPYVPPASTLPLTPPPKPTGNPWVASVRYDWAEGPDGNPRLDYSLGAPVDFTSAKLVETFNAPSTLAVLGRTDQMAEALGPGYGITLQDDHGVQRFSGKLAKIKRRGDGYVELTYLDDLLWLWFRKCYPVPAGDWTKTAQTAAYDVVTGPSETRLLTLVTQNLGASAPTAQPGMQPRQHPLLRVPTTLGRGTNASQSVRFDSLGDVVAALAEDASVRVQIVQTYDFDGTAHLDLKLTDAPDLSDWVSFGTPEGGGPYVLTDAWSYEIDIPLGTTVLSAAGGEGADRILTELTDADAEDLWGARIEMFLDQRGTTDPAEISNGILKALADNAGPTNVSVPVGNVPGLGSTIPLGSQVMVQLDDLPLVDRIRQVTTTLTNADGQPRVSVVGVIGDPTAGPQTPEQRLLAKVLKRLQNLENT